MALQWITHMLWRLQRCNTSAVALSDIATLQTNALQRCSVDSASNVAAIVQFKRMVRYISVNRRVNSKCALLNVKMRKVAEQ